MKKTHRPKWHQVIRWAAVALSVAAFGILLSLSPWRAQAITNVVSGTVYDQGSTPIVGAQVCVQGPVYECTTSGADGTFSFVSHPLPSGHYQEGWANPANGDTAHAPSLRTPFDVTEGVPTTLTYHLTTIQLSGKFKLADGTGVRGSLEVFNSDYSKNVRVEANDSGNYFLGGLTAGDYTAQPRTGWGVTGVVAPDPITVSLSDSAPITRDFVFTAATKTLTGKVTRSNGAAVPQACVNANRMNGAGNASVNTDDSGNYSLPLAGGSWNVQINPCQQGADWVYAGTPIMIDFATDSTVEAKVANFTATSASSTISGVVTDSNGAALTTGNINFRTQGGINFNGQIQSNGSYLVRIVAGTFNIDLWTPANAYSLPPTSVTISDNETRTLNLAVLSKSARITGTVKDANGIAASNVMINANEMSNTPGKPGSWGGARSDASGNFSIPVTPATYNINVSTEPSSQYIWANPTNIQIVVPAANSVVTPTDYPVLNFIVQKADSTIAGKLTAGGQTLSSNSLCVYARPVGAFNQSCSPVQQNGSFTIRVSSAIGTAYEMGCFSPPNMPYSCPQPVAVTITPNGTVNKDLDLAINNSSIVGQLYDQSGFPLSNCTSFRGGRVFADSPGGNGSHYEGEIGTDCRYKISLVAGVYSLNSFFPPESGAMNAPPGSPIQVYSGQSVQKNIMVSKADAMITVKLLDQNGNGTQGYINVDNNEEINASRSGDQGGQGKGGVDLGFGKKMPCNADPNNFESVKKCCLDSKNKQACTDFKVPEGPNGCDSLWTCVQQCKKDPSICNKAKQGDQNSGPQPGSGEFKTGPGGCASKEACETYCSQPAHQNECVNFKPPASAQSTGSPIRVISSKSNSGKVGASAVGSEAEKGKGFDQGIRASGPADMQGNARIQVLSGHRYTVCAGLPPDSSAMPPKCQTADLTKTKTASVTLQLRAADAQLTGTVKMPNGQPATRCFVHAWSEDGSFSGQPCAGNGTYKLNLTADTPWHFGADSMDGTKFYRSDEQTIVVSKTTKPYTRDLGLVEGNFEIPQPVTTSGDCSSPLVLSMSNRAKISIPAGGISTSSTGQCSCTASPTIDLISTKSNQPQGAGYTIDCRDENGAQVTTLKSSATITVPYNLSAKEEGTSVEDALKPVLYQSDTQSYKTVDSYTLDKTNNLITFSVDHFSAYTVSNSSGTSSKSAALVSVSSSKQKNGTTKIKVGTKSFTPFAKCKGAVSMATKSVNGTQLIAAVSSCDGNVRFYGTDAKSKKTINTGWKAGITSVGFSDVTKDGASDVVVAPVSGKEVKVIDVLKKYKTYKIVANSRETKLTANAIDFRGSGISNLVTGTVVNGQAGNFQVYSFSGGKFKATSNSYSAYLKNSSGAIAFVVPSPSVKSLKGSTVKKTATKAKVTINGSNLTADSTVMIGTVGGKVSFKNSGLAEVTFNATTLGAGKYSVKVINPGGKTTTAKTKVTVK